jgi:hypothetical protein
MMGWQRLPRDGPRRLCGHSARVEGGRDADYKNLICKRAGRPLPCWIAKRARSASTLTRRRDGPGFYRALPAPVVVVAFAATVYSAHGQPVDPTTVLAAARDALGGEKSLSAVKTFTATGRTRQVRGNNLVPIEFEINCELPDKFVRTDGLRWPFRIRRAIGSETIEETTFDRVRINARIDPKKFETSK